MDTQFDMPQEVKAYYASGRKRPIKVIANDDFTLLITFDNQEKRIYDMKDHLNMDVFSPLRTFKDFSRVYIDSRGSISWDIDSHIDSELVWNNKVDLCPDSCYIYSHPVD